MASQDSFCSLKSENNFRVKTHKLFLGNPQKVQLCLAIWDNSRPYRNKIVNKPTRAVLVIELYEVLAT